MFIFYVFWPKQLTKIDYDLGTFWSSMKIRDKEGEKEEKGNNKKEKNTIENKNIL